MSNTGDERGKGTIPPDWWLIEFRKARGLRPKEGTVELGKKLADLVDRGSAWNHSAVSNFFNEVRFTVEMAEAFSLHYGIPRFEKFIRAETIEEALRLEMFLGRAPSRVHRTDAEAQRLIAESAADEESPPPKRHPAQKKRKPAH